jgi:hypothetical protein
MELRPSEIFYSQDSIMNKFGDNTQHRNTYIGETLDQLLNEHCSVQSIPKISVEQRNGQWFTSDNRRFKLVSLLRHLQKSNKMKNKIYQPFEQS